MTSQTGTVTTSLLRNGRMPNDFCRPVNSRPYNNNINSSRANSSVAIRKGEIDVYVSKARLEDFEVFFQHPLEIVGCDEFSLYLADPMKRIGGLPYIREFSKDWVFVEASTGRNVHFEYRID